MDKRKFAEIWYQRFWCDEDLDVIDEMMTIDINVRGLTDAPQAGPAQFRAFAQALLAQISVDRVTIEHFMEQGDWAQMLLTFHARRRVDQEPVPFTAQVLARIVDDKIVEAYNHADFFALFHNLEKLPADTMERCLAGDRLH